MNNLEEKLKRYDFASLFKRKGFAWFTNGAYNLNIIGVRSEQGKKVTNQFDDFFVVCYKDKSGSWKRHVWPCTTEPGLDMMKNPMTSRGTAIVVPGQYRGVWQIGIHNGKYRALVQRKNPIKVYRDCNKDDVYDLMPRTIQNGVFGINMHRASQWGKLSVVGKYSAGCQVFQDPKDFNTMMDLADKQVNAGMGNSFTYTLVCENEL